MLWRAWILITSLVTALLIIESPTNNQAFKPLLSSTTTGYLGGLGWIRDTITTGQNTVTSPLYVSCPMPTCVAIDGFGNVFNATNAGQSTPWSSYFLYNLNEPPGDLSCDAAGECAVALLTTPGEVMWSNYPTIASRWIITQISGASLLQTISCVYGSGEGCLTGDLTGAVYGSTNGFQSNTTTSLTQYSIMAVSCPSFNFCAAVDSNGDFFYSNSPFNSSPQWISSGRADSSAKPSILSCASTSLCVIGDSAGNALSSTNPTSTTPTWNLQKIDNGTPLTSASCPTVSFCTLADTYGGNIFTSTNPAGGNWVMQHLFPGGGKITVDCSNSTFCILGHTDGHVYFSNNPTSASSWTSNQIDSVVEIFNTNCIQLPSLFVNGQPTDWCGAITGNSVLTAPAALSGTGKWITTPLLASAAFTSIACNYYLSGFLHLPSPWCIITASDGTVLYSNNPSGGSSAWNGPISVSTNPLVGSTCYSTSSCLAIDSQGNIYSTTNMGSSWNLQATLPINGSVGGITCAPPSQGACYAFDNLGDIWELYSTCFSSNGWCQITSSSNLSSGSLLTALSCPTASQCIASANVNGALFLSQLNSGAITTSSQFSSAKYQLIVSCPTTTTCFASDGVGDVFYSGNPFSSSPSYSSAQLDGVARPTSISCDSATFCAISDSDSSLLLGTNLPVITSVVSNEGPITGSQQLLISGLNLSSTTAVQFGSTNAQSFQTTAQGSIIAVTPAASQVGSVDIYVTNSVGVSVPRMTDQYNYVSGLPYFPVTPVRICDTRAGAVANPCNSGGAHTLGPGGTLNLQVTGNNGVPSSAVAVVLNVTVTDTTAWSYLTIWPTGTTRPVTSNLNWQSYQTVANLTTPTLSSSGSISFYNAFGKADVVVDLEGYFAPYSSASASGAYIPFGPMRIVDTRSNSGYFGAGSTLKPGATLTFSVVGYPIYPSALVLNVTATNTTANGGYLTIWPAGQTKPLASNLNWNAGQTVANRVIVPVGTNLSVSIYNASGNTDVIVDISGYLTDTTLGIASGSYYNAVSPQRICDTRSGVAANQCNQNGNGTLGPSSVLKVSSPNLASNEVALMTNTTATNTTTWGYLSVAPDGQPAPYSSDINWNSANQTVPNAVLPGLSTSGVFDVYNALGKVDVIVDLEGYFQ
jgi:hypothetical protein